MTIPSELAQNPIVHKLRSFNAASVRAASNFRNQLALVIPAELIRSVCEFLRDDPELQFNFLVDVTAVDRYPDEPRFEVVYHLRAMHRLQRLRLKALVSGQNPRIESLYGLWPAADMLEREVFDLFGIHFTGHPNLRRLLMPADWEGYPLRKDYPVEGHR
ncbi:MAG: NADH-quinone oxidoreductase subunit C [Terriglobia bacterium]